MKSFFAILMLVSISTQAAEPICRIHEWPFSRDLDLPAISEQLEKLPRQRVLQYAWGELTLPQEKPMIAPFLMYLAGTEKNKNLEGYYKAMGYFALGKVELQTALKEWPKNRKPHDGKGMSLQELCKLYEKSKETNKSTAKPISTKKK